MVIKKRIRLITFSALLIALDIVFTRFLKYEVFPYDRYSLQFLAHGLGGAMLGPFAAITAAAADVVGIVFDGRALNPFITLLAALRGLIYGCCFTRRRGSRLSGKTILLRTLIAVTAVTLICDLFGMSLIFDLMYGYDFWVVFLSKLPFRIASVAVYSFVLWFVWTRLKATRLFNDLL